MTIVKAEAVYVTVAAMMTPRETVVKMIIIGVAVAKMTLVVFSLEIACAMMILVRMKMIEMYTATATF